MFWVTPVADAVLAGAVYRSLSGSEAGGAWAGGKRRQEREDSNMRLIGFVKTTVLGGAIFLVPMIVIVVVVGKALQISMKVAEPLARFIPIDSVAGFALANVIAGAGIVVVCFVAGLAARTSLASTFVREAETRFLWKIPGYGFIRGMADSFRGDNGGATMRPVLAKLDDAAQVAFEVERLGDGRVVVYMPGAPDPWSGAILVMTEDRIQSLPITMVSAVQNLRMLGRGTGQILAGASAGAEGRMKASAVRQERKP